jgi:hypothetical protein
MKYIIVINIYPGDIIIDITVSIGHNNKLSAKYPNNKFINVNITSKLKEIHVVMETGLHK